jgi:hypothetical protein
MATGAAATLLAPWRRRLADASPAAALAVTLLALALG